MFGLADCVSFYASCEKVFRPDLARRPVIVLSNNDGCVVARSPEAKAWIEMGAPFFQVKEIAKKHQMAVFSSNYALYASLSQRVMNIFRRFVAEVEVYSIDECFLNLSGYPQPLPQYARTMQQTVAQCTGIPTRIGIGPTKVLAKMANQLARREESGVLVLQTEAAIQAARQDFPIAKVWGIGPQYGRFLQARGITTAQQFCQQSDAWLRKHLSVVGLRLALELRGQSCLGLEEVVPKKSLCVSRSFSQALTAYAPLKEKIALFATRLGEKLRLQQSAPTLLSVFLRTDPFRPEQAQYRNSQTLRLPLATHYTPELVKAAFRALQIIYREGYAYRKAGVWVTGLVPEDQTQGHLFLSNPAQDKTQKTLMQTLDALNARWGARKVQLAALGTQPTLRAHTKWLSPRYTTHWGEILKVRI
ncbi:MAG: Y-family DNA polymerase [Microscillaceae bacterium]